MVSDWRMLGTMESVSWSLNPCCNGIWSQTMTDADDVYWNFQGLNPCCNGIWSQTP